MDMTLVAYAAGLLSDGGTNPEYDRALVELVTYASGLSSDDFAQVESTIKNF